jgi:hypothetical protein
MIKISKETQNRMRQFMLTEQEVYLASLIAAGHSDEEAYSLIYEPNTLSDESLHVLVGRVTSRKKGIKDLVDTLTRVNMKGLTAQIGSASEAMNKKLGRKSKKKSAGEGGFDPTNKDSIIRVLSDQLELATDPKTKTDIAMKIADLQRMKQDENKDEQELVHFYLPLTCKRCSLYVAEKKRKEGNQ